MAPKKQNNRTKLTLAQVLEKLGYNPKSDVPYKHNKAPTFYDPYDSEHQFFPDPLDPRRRDNSFNKKGYMAPGPKYTYSDGPKEPLDVPNMDRIELRMPQYDGIPKKEKNRKKLAEALSRHIGKILPF